VESPLQLLSVVEAHAAGLLGPTTVVTPRADVRTLTSTAAAVRELDLPPGLTIDESSPATPFGRFGGDTWCLGDPFSGRAQADLLTHRVPRLVVVDDGLATREFLRRIGGNRPMLIRPRTRPDRRRRAIGRVAGHRVQRLARRGRVTVHTAMEPPPAVVDQAAARGVEIVSHRFRWLATQPTSTTPEETLVVLGSPLVDDGLVHADAYLGWLAEIAMSGPAVYYPHRREGDGLVGKVRALGFRIAETGRPVEIALRGLTERHRVVSLATSAAITLRALLGDSGTTFDTVSVPDSWWLPDVAADVRARFGDTRWSGAHVLAISDSDSYLKWAAGMVDGLPTGWSSTSVIVRTPIRPSAAQIRAAVAGTGLVDTPPSIASERRVRTLAERLRPDVVLVATTGPVADVLLRRTLADLQPRPVLVTGLPGISVPATEKALVYRSAADLFVAHSRREVADFAALAEGLGLDLTIGLGRLPALDDVGEPAPTRDRIVFAAQAKTPESPDERERTLLALAALAEERPDLDVVVKLRAVGGEAQTHREDHAYDHLWRRLVARRVVRPDAVRFAAGSMAEHLAHAAGFVTVGSTAALEAIAARIPTLVLTDFGVGAETFNLTFTGSGLFGTLEDLAAGRFHEPDPTWLADNYFHDPTDVTWLSDLGDLVTRAATTGLPPATSLMDAAEHASARARAVRRLSVPPPLLRIRNAAGRRLHAVRRQLDEG
jgi:hypothetical protein